MWLNILRVKSWKHLGLPAGATSRFFQTTLGKILDLLELLAKPRFAVRKILILQDLLVKYCRK